MSCLLHGRGLTIFGRKFWKLTSSHHLIRPLSMRPSHHLPNVGAPTSTIRRHRAAPKRARRCVIDPSLWNPTHLSQTAFQDDWLPEAKSTNWEYNDLNGYQDFDNKGLVMIGVWKRMREGEVIEEDYVRSNRWGPDQSESETQTEDAFVDVYLSNGRADPDGKISPPLTRVSGEASPLFARRTTPDTSAEQLPSSSISPQDGPAPAASSIAGSPLFPARTASPLTEVSSLPAPIGPLHSQNGEAFPVLPERFLKEARAERAAALDVLHTFLGTADLDGPAKTSSRSRRHEWAGFSESEDEEEDEMPLRLRGGNESSTSGSRPSASLTSGNEDESSLEGDDLVADDSDDSSDNSDETSTVNSETIDDDELVIPSEAKPDKLKSMFAPSSSVTGAYHATTYKERRSRAPLMIATF